MEDRTRVHVFVAGDVQGVNFRQAIADKANEQGVTGWVKNLNDGRVEAVLEGPRDEVYRVVGLCRAGPKGARVAGVQVDREPPRNEKTFKVK
ncbi:MAG: acylphosphatase [Actinomycetota bacterium]|nr:acylphosphatase [Actinomycetota bacterium]MEA2488137.1 acylphosphatase [Actinomycetota bacterium]